MVYLHLFASIFHLVLSSRIDLSSAGTAAPWRLKPPRDCWRWPWQDQERSGMFAGGTVPWPKCPQCGYWLRFASSVPHPLTVFFSPYFLAAHRGQDGQGFILNQLLCCELCAERQGSTSKISTPMVYSKSLNSLSWTSSLLSSIMAQISIATFLKRSTEIFFEAWSSWIALQSLQLNISRCYVLFNNYSCTYMHLQSFDLDIFWYTIAIYSLYLLILTLYRL